jgi:RNA polymerase sigma-70 factor (ECF subfamily)
LSTSRRPLLRLVHSAPEAGPSPGPPVSAQDDQALVAGLARRDARASSAFYDRVRPIIDRTLLRLLGASDSDYEDVAQAALYTLVEGIGAFRGECPLDAWTSIVTARIAYRTIRRRRLERRFFAQSSFDAAASVVSVAPTRFASRQAVERVRAHLERMDPKRAWTFLLHDVHGYGLEQISEIMETSASAAQSRLVRGRRELHERIGGDAELAHFLDDLSEDVP